MCEVIDFNLYVDNTSHMEYITFYTIKRTAFDILAYFWPELSGSIYTWTLLVYTPENYSYLHRLD